jgi:hypothetical protein
VSELEREKKGTKREERAERRQETKKAYWLGRTGKI